MDTPLAWDGSYVSKAIAVTFASEISRSSALNADFASSPVPTCSILTASTSTSSMPSPSNRIPVSVCEMYMFLAMRCFARNSAPIPAFSIWIVSSFTSDASPSEKMKMALFDVHETFVLLIRTLMSKPWITTWVRTTVWMALGETTQKYEKKCSPSTNLNPLHFENLRRQHHIPKKARSSHPGDLLASCALQRLWPFGHVWTGCCWHPEWGPKTSGFQSLIRRKKSLPREPRAGRTAFGMMGGLGDVGKKESRHRTQPLPTKCVRWRWPVGNPDPSIERLTWKPRGWSWCFVSRKRRPPENCHGSGGSTLHPEGSASPTMHLQMDPGVHTSPTLPMPTVSHHVEVPQYNSQMWGMTFWIGQLKSPFHWSQFFLPIARLPGTNWRPVTGKYQTPALSATLHKRASAFPFPQVALALWLQAPTCWKSLDSSQWSLSIFCHWRTGFPTDWTWYISLCSIRRYHRYPHPQSWVWSPAQRAPTGWLSKRVEPLPLRSTAARSIVPGGIGRLVYETWQEFVSRRNDCGRWNRTLWKKIHVPGRSKTSLLLVR